MSLIVLWFFRLLFLRFIFNSLIFLLITLIITRHWLFMFIFLLDVIIWFWRWFGLLFFINVLIWLLIFLFLMIFQWLIAIRGIFLIIYNLALTLILLMVGHLFFAFFIWMILRNDYLLFLYLLSFKMVIDIWVSIQKYFMIFNDRVMFLSFRIGWLLTQLLSLVLDLIFI